MILNPTKLLFDLANEEAKKLQEKQGRTPRGIVSTQVQGLIIALGNTMEILTLDYQKEISALRKQLKFDKDGNLLVKNEEY